jgi:hypothetical protein
LRTETFETLANLGVSENAPPLWFNYAEVDRETEPVFPEEYTLETVTGLVPEEAVKQVRSRTSHALPIHDIVQQQGAVHAGDVAVDLLGPLDAALGVDVERLELDPSACLRLRLRRLPRW